MLEKFMFTCGYLLHRLTPLLGTKLGFLLVPFTFLPAQAFPLAGAFRVDYVAACSTALRSASEENGSGDNVTVPCPFIVTQHSRTADWLKF